MIESEILAKGEVEIIQKWLDGKELVTNVPNTVLITGRQALAKCLANALGGGSFNFYVTTMLFGDGGTINGVKKYVNTNRNGLFGVTQLSKPVLANLDPTLPTQVIFTSVIMFQEAVGVTLNEMALQMASGDFYSMTTFPDLNKTSDMQITWNWRLSYI